MTQKSLMLLLPEVAHFVDRIPIAKVVLKPSAVHLRFMQHARDSRMPLKKQCEALNIPWHARKVPAALASKNVLKVARILSPSTFCQTLPSEKSDVAMWCDAVLTGRHLAAHSLRWLAFHGKEIREEGDHRLILDYLRRIGSISASVPIDVVKRRAEKKRAGERVFHTGGFINIIVNREGVMAQIAEARQRLEDEVFRVNPGYFALDRGSDRTPIEYPEHLREPWQHGDLTVTLCRTPDDFRNAGEELQNCICDRRTHFQSDYFSLAKAGRLHIAIARRGGEAISALEFGPDWTLKTALGPRNASITDPEVLIAAQGFGRKADECQDSQDRQPRRDILREMIRQLRPSPFRWRP